MLNKIKMPHPLLIFSQSDYLLPVVDTYWQTEWQTVQIQISWLYKPTDLDLHCLQRQNISGFSRTRVKVQRHFKLFFFYIVMYFKWEKYVIMCTQSEDTDHFGQSSSSAWRSVGSLYIHRACSEDRCTCWSDSLLDVYVHQGYSF